MKVLLVNTGIIPVPCERGAAIEAHTYYLANGLAELGCDVHYVTDLTRKARLHDRVSVHRVHAPRMKFPTAFPWWILTHLLGGTLAFISAVLALVRERFSFDAIHVHEEAMGLLIVMLKKSMKLGIPIVFTLHNPIAMASNAKASLEQRVRGLIFRVTGRTIIRNCDHFIALSTRIGELVTSRFHYPKERVSVIGHGVDAELFRPQEPLIDEARAKYGIDGTYCLFVGRLDRRKGVDLLLSAFSQIGQTRYKCVVVGEGRERRSLTDLAVRLKVDGDVLFTGAVPLHDLTALYSGAEFLVLPTYAEAAPMVVLEALASGIPVVTTDVPGMEDVVWDGFNGFVVRRNARELCRSIELLMRDGMLRARLKENARLSALQEHSWRRTAERTLQAYARCLRGLTLDQ